MTPSLSQRLLDAWKRAAFHVLRHMPLDMVSALGGAIVRWSVPRHRPGVVAGARRNLQRLSPETGAADIESTVASFIDNVGRTMAEFALLHRIAAAGRITQADENFDAVRSHDAPVIGLCLHTGNWEVGAALIPRTGVRLASISVEPESSAERAIAADVRARLGCTVFPADLSGLRRAMAWLETGTGPRLLIIFGDEARRTQLMAPLFGRAAHTKGNLALVAQMARRYACPIVIMYGDRTEGCRFVVHVSPPVWLPDGQDTLEDVRLLNAMIEPIIRARLGQWYFLDNPF